MKFWEFISAFREFDGIVAATLASPKWQHPFGDWYVEKDGLIQRQDRAKLDSILPEALVLEVAAAVGDRLSFHLKGGWLRRQPPLSEGQRLSSRDVIARFGGAVLEEVLEYGSAKVET